MHKEVPWTRSIATSCSTEQRSCHFERTALSSMEQSALSDKERSVTSDINPAFNTIFGTFSSVDTPGRLSMRPDSCTDTYKKIHTSRQPVSDHRLWVPMSNGPLSQATATNQSLVSGYRFVLLRRFVLLQRGGFYLVTRLTESHGTWETYLKSTMQTLVPALIHSPDPLLPVSQSY